MFSLRLTGVALRIVTRFAFAAAMLLAIGCDRGAHPDRLNQPAPQFQISDGTRTVRLSDYRGRVVLVNFWATYCAPCLEELPSLVAMQHELPQVTVIAISLDDDEEAYKAFIIKHHVDLLTVRDPQHRVNPLFGTTLIPDTYVIDRNGLIQRKYAARDWTSPEIIAYLRQL